MKKFSATHDSHGDRNLGGVTTFPSPTGSSRTTITWAGEATPDGVEPLDVLKATMDRLIFLQKTKSATEDNAKAMFKLQVLLEEIEKKPPTMGGELNNLIPKE